MVSTFCREDNGEQNPLKVVCVRVRTCARVDHSIWWVINGSRVGVESEKKGREFWDFLQKIRVQGAEMLPWRLSIFILLSSFYLPKICQSCEE